MLRTPACTGAMAYEHKGRSNVIIGSLKIGP